MSPRFALTCAVKDLRRRAADPLALGGWVGVPLLVGALIALVAGALGDPPRTRLLVSGGGDLLAVPGVAEPVAIEPAGEAEGRRAVERGDAAALLVLPAGREGIATLAVGATDRIRPAVAADAAAAFVERAAHPSAPRIDVVDAGSTAPRVPVGLLFVPGVLLMALLFVAVGMAEDLWAEREAGTLRRALASPNGATSVLAGKALAGGALMLSVSVLGLSLSAALLEVPWPAVPGAAAMATLAGVTLLCVFSALHVHAQSLRGGRLTTAVVLFPLLMLGGSFFPLSRLPEALATAGRYTPNGMAVARIGELLSGEASAPSLAVTALTLAAVALVSGAFAGRRLARAFVRGGS